MDADTDSPFGTSSVATQLTGTYILAVSKVFLSGWPHRHIAT